MKKKASLIAVLLVLCLMMTACGSSSTAATIPAEPEAKILTVQVGPDPETLDPALNSAVDGGNMLLHHHYISISVRSARLYGVCWYT